MNSRFDDLWASAADDGASCPVGLDSTRTEVDEAETDHLMEAWLRERTDRIECVLVLDEACRLIAALLADGVVTPRRRRQARRLFRVIRGIKRDDRGDYPS